MNTLQSKVTSKGQVVIPKHIREHYGIKQSTVIRWVEKSEGVLMIPDTEDTIASVRGMFKKSDMLKKLLAARARDRAKEATSGKAG